MTPANRIKPYLDPYMATLSAIDNTDHPHECDCLAKAKFLAIDAAQIRDEVWEREKEAIRMESESENRLDAVLLVQLTNRRLADDAKVDRNIAARDRKAWHGFAWFCGLSVLLHIALIAGRLLL